MGAQPSKTLDVSMSEKAVMDRLRNVQLDDEDYVEVDSGSEKRGLGGADRSPEGLSLSLVTSWQTSILDDPKNR